MSERLTTKELAERWRTTQTALANSRFAGRGPDYIKIGKKVLYELKDVIAYEQKVKINGEANQTE